VIENHNPRTVNIWQYLYISRNNIKNIAVKNILLN